MIKIEATGAFWSCVKGGTGKLFKNRRFKVNFEVIVELEKWMLNGAFESHCGIRKRS